MEHFSFVALLTPLFSLFMVLRALVLFSKRKQTWRELLWWIVLWSGIGLVAVYPGVLDHLPPFIGIKSGVNVLIFFGFILLFYGFFRLFIKVEELEEKIVKMNREGAIGENEKRKT
ncbi:MAG: DUF2304 domain-containing protein [Candidatus Altimarinota bacterium]